MRRIIFFGRNLDSLFSRERKGFWGKKALSFRIPDSERPSHKDGRRKSHGRGQHISCLYFDERGEHTHCRRCYRRRRKRRQENRKKLGNNHLLSRKRRDTLEHRKKIRNFSEVCCTDQRPSECKRK